VLTQVDVTVVPRQVAWNEIRLKSKKNKNEARRIKRLELATLQREYNSQ
jgi:hypothetical protein